MIRGLRQNGHLFRVTVAGLRPPGIRGIETRTSIESRINATVAHKGCVWHECNPPCVLRHGEVAHPTRNGGVK